VTNADFTYAIREPTGLGLGTFDVYLIRQKLYRGEFHSKCEFQTADGDWHALTEHPAFAEVLWLVGDKGKSKGIRRRAIGAGWKIQGEETVQQHRKAVRLDDKAPATKRPKPVRSDDKKGLLGRFFGGKK
jgi:hypothetical protein